MLKTSTGKPTKAQAARFMAIKESGCLCCWIINGINNPPEIHHLTSGGRRIGHDATIGLCPYHHRGTKELGDFGPPLAAGSKPFHAHWGTDEELLKLQNERLCAHS